MKRFLAVFLAAVQWAAIAVSAGIDPAAEQISVSMDLPAASVTQAEDGFVDVSADGFAYSGKPARPRLPEKNLYYALPPDVDPASVSIVITKLETRD
ncbi:MAG: hypothetical protein KKC51_10990, partial [Verrucomicrobia bacterium]|nr:hypothetical protein [Verrucomicrobiota bacterium]